MPESRPATCESTRSLGADRHVKLLIHSPVAWSRSGAYSHWVEIGGALLVLLLDLTLLGGALQGGMLV
jgi:hypothetical protein